MHAAAPQENLPILEIDSTAPSTAPPLLTFAHREHDDAPVVPAVCGLFFFFFFFAAQLLILVLSPHFPACLVLYGVQCVPRMGMGMGGCVCVCVCVAPRQPFVRPHVCCTLYALYTLTHPQKSTERGGFPENGLAPPLHTGPSVIPFLHGLTASHCCGRRKSGRFLNKPGPNVWARYYSGLGMCIHAAQASRTNSSVFLALPAYLLGLLGGPSRGCLLVLRGKARSSSLFSLFTLSTPGSSP